MRKIALTLTAAAFVFGTFAIAANAQTHSLGAAGFHAQMKSATPIVTLAACNGRTGGHGCGAGIYLEWRSLRSLLITEVFASIDPDGAASGRPRSYSIGLATLELGAGDNRGCAESA